MLASFMSLNSWALTAGSYKLEIKNEEAIYAVVDKVPGANHAYNLFLFQWQDYTNRWENENVSAWGNAYFIEETHKGKYRVRSYGHIGKVPFFKKKDEIFNQAAFETYLLADYAFSGTYLESSRLFRSESFVAVGELKDFDKDSFFLSVDFKDDLKIEGSSALLAKTIRGQFKRDDNYSLVSWNEGVYEEHNEGKKHLYVEAFDRQKQMGLAHYLEKDCYERAFGAMTCRKFEHMQVQRAFNKLYLFEGPTYYSRESEFEDEKFWVTDSVDGQFALIFIRQNNKFFKNDYYVIDTRKGRVFKKVD